MKQTTNEANNDNRNHVSRDEMSSQLRSQITKEYQIVSQSKITNQGIHAIEMAATHDNIQQCACIKNNSHVTKANAIQRDQENCWLFFRPNEFNVTCHFSYRLLLNAMSKQILLIQRLRGGLNE
jgi:hypothetical protein